MDSNGLPRGRYAPWDTEGKDEERSVYSRQHVSIPSSFCSTPLEMLTQLPGQVIQDTLGIDEHGLSGIDIGFEYSGAEACVQTGLGY